MVYPRVCGGTNLRPDSPALNWGLSPRVRGNLPTDQHPLGCIGSIPACAGEPSPGNEAGRFSEVYPRVCGGTALVSLILGIAQGLSPRVRGNLGERRLRIRQTGSIPACAGEPASKETKEQSDTVYPRVCGGTAE